MALPEFLQQLVEPWYRSLSDPATAQEESLRTLISGYRRTEYGARHGADGVQTVADYTRAFPVVRYAGLESEIDQVRSGNFASLLPEPVARWVMTRGSTGRSKIVPATETYLSQILTLGARAIVNFASRLDDMEVLEGGVLNLNFPSEVAALQTPGREEMYGYSSGTYAKLNPSLGAASLVPRQEEIDSLGGGITRADWEKRFELVYEKAKGADVKSVMGVTPVILSFANFVRRKKHVKPKEVWRMKGLFCTSVAKIQTRYAPQLKFLYGDVPVVEMYTATEGIFAQQLDDLPYVSPNYDAYLFEVQGPKGMKPLHELKPREWGRVVVSTPLFPRYDIGDLIESMGKGYFRVFGRAKAATLAEHRLFNLMTGRFF